MLHRQPVLIIGAGIAGLVLAQGLRKLGIPFLIFERDTAANSRLQGWALTIHFALSQLIELLPDDILEQLDEVQVDPHLAYDRSNSVFINLETCEYKWKLPPGYGTRKRLARDRFRQLLLTGLEEHIHWGKEFVSFTVTEGLPTAIFKDGTMYNGQLLVGADGSSSRLRLQLYDLSLSPVKPLPITFLGTSLLVKEQQLLALRDIDPTLFQGCHPRSATWMWFSIMESPAVNGTASLLPEERLWKIQLCLSWPSSNTKNAEDLSTDELRVQAMRQKAAEFHDRLKEIFYNGLSRTHRPVLKINLFDWSIPDNRAFDPNGAVVLVGDAAHTMSMYRGEGFNHSIIDAYHLVNAIKKMHGSYNSEANFEVVRKRVIEEYEAEVKTRGRSAVAFCREACLEVHDWDKLSENSVVRKRSAHIV